MNLYFSGLTKSYNGKTVFENINGAINDKDKIGLVGANGIGKSTLVKLVAGLEHCDSGEIRRSPSNMKILYIEQYPVFDKDISVYNEIFRVASANPSNNIKDMETMVKKALNKVGLVDDKWGQDAASLSGGEKTKLALCRAIITDYDLLILDEPTNHLDINSYEWLEEFVRNLNKPFVVISHDRFFLDIAANKIWELSSRGLGAYEGNYSAYRVQKEIEHTSAERLYENQQMKIQHLKQVINQRKDWYKSAHKSAGQNDFYRSKAKKHARVLKAKQKNLERIEKVKIDKPEKPVSPAFEVINKNIIGRNFPRFLIQAKNLTKSFDEKIIFENISFNLKQGDKIALIGQNGAGKTTFLKTICGLDKNYNGEISITPSVKIGYFAQELDNLNNRSEILEDVLYAGSAVEDTRMILASLLFKGDDVYKKIGNLSMGEKGRVAFAKLILSGANLLILDEPTNYMDMQSKEKVEDVLEKFAGSIIFVSHDRYFIKRLANRVFVIDNRKLYLYDGDYGYYLNKCREHKAKNRFGMGYDEMADNIRRLECELAFLGGKLSEKLDEEEKEELNRKFLATAKELNECKKMLKRQQG
jgi:ATP-binding cassette subfamily F protein 3